MDSVALAGLLLEPTRRSVLSVGASRATGMQGLGDERGRRAAIAGVAVEIQHGSRCYYPWATASAATAT